MDRVTAADLQRVAKPVLHEGEPHGRRVPAQGGRGAAAEDPELAALPAAGAGHGAAAACSRSQAETDAAQAAAKASPRCSEAAGQVPPEMKPVFELIAEDGAGAPGRAGEREEVSAMTAAVASPSPLAAAGRPAPSRRPSPTTRTSSSSSRSRSRRRRPRDHRVVLKNGMVVYIAEDPTLPLVNIALTVRTGALPRARGQGGPGRAHRRRRSAAAAAQSLTAEQLDERLDFLAANVVTGIGDTAGRPASTACATTSTSRCGSSSRCCKQPRFQEDRLALAKEQALQEMKKRNDDAADIERREWNVAPLRREALHQPLHHRGLARGDHPRGPRRLPPRSTSTPRT